MLRRRAVLGFLCALGCGCERRATWSGSSEAVGIRYVELLMGGASASERLPLVVAMHGRSGRPEKLAKLFDGFVARARIILPYGVERSHDGFAWFHGGDSARAAATNIEQTTDRLAKLLEALSRDRPTAGKPIVTGFSQGGFASYALAVLHPELVGEAYPVSGLLPAELWPSSWPKGVATPPIHAFHGDADDMVSIDDDRQTVRRLRELGFAVDLREYPRVEHTISPEMRRDIQAALALAVARAART